MMTNNAFHPGVFLHELIEWQNITPVELAEQTGIPEDQIIDITQQRQHVDQQVSERLADYFGNSSRFWMNLQKSFNRRSAQPEHA